MKNIFLSSVVMLMAATMTASGTGAQTVQVRAGHITDCLGAAAELHEAQEAVITVYTSLYSGLAVGPIRQHYDAAYFDFVGFDADVRFVYRLTGETGQYSCGITCNNPTVPSVEVFNNWTTQAMDAIVKVRAQDIPPPPTCPRT